MLTGADVENARLHNVAGFSFLTRISVNSASCAAYCVVNAAGMCCTRIARSRNFLVKPGADASPWRARQWKPDSAGKHHRRRKLRFCSLARAASPREAHLATRIATPQPTSEDRANHANLGGHFNFRSRFSQILCISRSMALLLGLAINSMAPSSEAFECADGAFARFGTHDDNRPRIGGHNLRGGLQTIHVGHGDIVHHRRTWA